jgi:hypothetical protein
MIVENFRQEQLPLPPFGCFIECVPQCSCLLAECARQIKAQVRGSLPFPR